MPDRVAAARNLTAAIEGFNERLDRAERRERRLVFWLRGAFGVIAVLGLLTGLMALQNAHRNDIQDTQTVAREQQIAAMAVANCVAGNQTRAADLAAEEKFISFTESLAPDSRVVRARAARVLAAFRAKDTQRKCRR